MKLNRITAMLMLSTLPLLANAASYTVVELPTSNLSLNQFGSAIDETGMVLTTLNQPFNPPIDLSLIDLSDFTLNDPEGAALGNFDDQDYSIIASFLYNQTRNQTQSTPWFGQNLATQIVYSTDGTDVKYLSGLDQVSSDTNGFSFAQRTSVGDSTNGTHIVGTMSGPFSKIAYTNANDNEQTFNVNDFAFRGFVQVGNTVTELVPENIMGGGLSSANAINAALQVAGSTSIAPGTLLGEAIDNCNNVETRGDQLAQTCLARLRLARRNGADTYSASFTQRAAIWQLDANGEVLSTTTYGLVFEPEAESTAILSTAANAINDNGVAVGVSDAPYFNRIDDAAVIFENGTTIRVIEDVSLMPNSATGINNDGMIIGFQRYAVGRDVRTKMFTFDRNTDALNFVDGLFVNSSTIPRAINNSNLVVGEADVESGQNARQKGAFLYDINTDNFTTLNSLIACDAEYNIVSADDINDSGVIVASALVKRLGRDVQGNDNGRGLIDTIVAVKLIPTGEAPSVCTPTESEIDAGERQGAGVGFLALLGLFAISLIRRRRKFI